MDSHTVLVKRFGARSLTGFLVGDLEGQVLFPSKEGDALCRAESDALGSCPWLLSSVPLCLHEVTWSNYTPSA